ncbi:hypothetical protein COT20_01775 [bacterium (Candidatus Gribaldobacteria) CG08_land_8_20_14_0_20_39_15]|uniref:Uncharacterized protein n=1 Tax=bacterium (Candidatus Gribaldobacteria) CG08_land_8_20_14_0_20_39_15 TaxID=2014273 RepID=A0A2M6XUE8_9BACT|nr:MAG: hypothetical protein COT20_01775 [bacterium (Candidatus Gribaldobacteria) CG08_land_8_20_14_0_20_39_15]
MTLKEKFGEKMLNVTEKMPRLEGIFKVFPGLIVPFDPEEELVKIRRQIKSAPAEKQSQLRKEKLSAFKEKFIQQRLKLAQIQNKLEDFVENNPDAKANEISNTVKRDILVGKINPIQDTKIHLAIHKYVTQHKIIKHYLKEFQGKYLDSGEGEDILWRKELFKAIFGFYPADKIGLVIRPATLYWRCFNIDDFAKTIGHKPQEVEHTLGLRGPANCQIPELRGNIAVENTSVVEKLSSEQCLKTLIHEESHVIEDFLPHKVVWTERSIENLTPQSTMEEIQTAIFKRIKEKFAFYQNEAKFEILARLREGQTPVKIYLKLIEKQGAYNWPVKYKLADKLKEEIQKQCNPNQDMMPMINTIIVNRMKEYQIIVARALDAVTSLKNKFSEEEAITLLSQESLDKWHRLDNLVEETFE